MTIFIVRSDGAHVAFDGMTEAQVAAMLADQGKTCQFVDKATHDAALEAIDEVAKPVAIDPAIEKSTWLAQKAKGTDQAIAFLAAKLGLE